MISMIFVMAWFPQIGYIQIFPSVGITIIHIPVLIGAMVYKKSGLVLGTAFGISSLMIAFIRPVTPIDFLFQNPLVSVLPRMIFGFSIYYIHTFFERLELKSSLTMLLSLTVSTLWHSVLVLGMIYLFGMELLGGSTAALQILGTILLTNATIEAIVAASVGTIVARRLHAFIG